MHGSLRFCFTCAAKIFSYLKSSALLNVDRGSASFSTSCQEAASVIVPLHNNAVCTGICMSAISVKEHLADLGLPGLPVTVCSSDRRLKSQSFARSPSVCFVRDLTISSSEYQQACPGLGHASISGAQIPADHPLKLSDSKFEYQESAGTKACT